MSVTGNNRIQVIDLTDMVTVIDLTGPAAVVDLTGPTTVIDLTGSTSSETAPAKSVNKTSGIPAAAAPSKAFHMAANWRDQKFSVLDFDEVAYWDKTFGIHNFAYKYPQVRIVMRADMNEEADPASICKYTARDMMEYDSVHGRSAFANDHPEMLWVNEHQTRN
ncbi:hypothetical protein F4780DRAFT_779847 [Xylariomycetidae sp. FL0641]|nr:hypothetical protein F4780DRAFT_779847 [Xylariomycetidae sp. FL0641]